MSRRRVTRAGEGHHVTQFNADYEYLCGDYLYRKVVTGIAVISARSLDEHGPFVNHPGEGRRSWPPTSTRR